MLHLESYKKMAIIPLAFNGDPLTFPEFLKKLHTKYNILPKHMFKSVANYIKFHWLTVR